MTHVGRLYKYTRIIALRWSAAKAAGSTTAGEHSLSVLRSTCSTSPTNCSCRSCVHVYIVFYFSDPNSNGVATFNNDLPVWRQFDLSEEIYISFSHNSGPIARHGYRHRECTFWSDLAPKIENTIQHCSK